MFGSASGPLGALLLIAPLAAIPVFAIVGVPQFAQLVASPSDDEDVSDLGETTSSHSSGTGSSATGSSATGDARPGRSADDLFAPLDESPIRSEALSGSRARQAPSAATAPGRSRNSALPPPDALDQWEIRPNTPDVYARNGEGSPQRQTGDFSGASTEADQGLEIPADGSDDDQLSPEGFSADLLRPDRVTKAPRTTERGPVEPAARSLARPQKSSDIDPASDPLPSGDLQTQAMSEQSGWQAAAQRLKKLGIKKYRLESQIEEQTFVFMCTFSSTDNPRVSRRFEADADTPLEAVQRVLEQIDEWRTRNSPRE